jgi:hypothetical protein
MVQADPTVLGLRTSQGEYAEKPPSSYQIYQWTLGPNLSPLQVAARFGHMDTGRLDGDIRNTVGAVAARVSFRRSREGACS